MRLDKKGNIGMLTPAVISLTLGAVILVFGLLMLQDLYVDTANQESATVTNETMNVSTGNVVGTGGADEFNAASSHCGFNTISISQVVNGSSGIVIGSGNYTIVGNSIRNLSNYWTDKQWNVTYSYKYGLDACTKSNESMVGLGKMADYFDLVVLGVVISIILGLVIVSFAFRKVKS